MSALASDKNGFLQTRNLWLSMGGLALLLLGVLGYLLFTDCNPPDDAALMPAGTPVWTSDNPLAVFYLAAGDRAEKAANDLPPEADRFPRSQEAVVRKFASEHERERQLLREFIQTKPSAWMWPPDGEKVGMYEAGRACWGVSKACEAHARVLIWSGDTTQAIETALMLAKFGRRLQSVPSYPWHLVQCAEVQQRGEALLQEALLPCHDDSLLKKVQDELSALEPSERDCIAAWKEFYAIMKKAVHDLGQGDPDQWKYTIGADPSKGRLLFHPNRTLSVQGKWLGESLTAMERGWPEAFRVMRDYSMKAESQSRRGVMGNLSPNFYGRVLILRFWMGFDHKPLGKLLTTVAQHRMTVTNLALRRYELARGKLPHRLEELVPEFLQSVPEDPFTGVPLHWDAARGYLYSLGENGVDDHGNPSEAALPGRVSTVDVEFWAPMDIVMPYWWWSPQAGAVGK